MTVWLFNREQYRILANNSECITCGYPINGADAGFLFDEGGGRTKNA